VNSTQTIITVSYGVLTLIGVIVILAVFRSTRHRKDDTYDREEITHNEDRWAMVVGGFLVTVLVLTIVNTPYFRAKKPFDNAPKVAITGQQFAWTVNPPQAKVGKLRIIARTRDVSHAIGLYDPDNVLVGQVNVITGGTQELDVELKKPGIYRILCLEFCGINHDIMRNTLRVTN